MRDDNLKKNKLSWSKSLVRKWFNIKTKSEDFHADDIVYGGGYGEWRNNFNRVETCTVKKSKTVVGTWKKLEWCSKQSLPCEELKTIPRPIPEKKWYLTPSVVSLMGGLLPFGSIFKAMDVYSV